MQQSTYEIESKNEIGVHMSKMNTDPSFGYSQLDVMIVDLIQILTKLNTFLTLFF